MFRLVLCCMAACLFCGCLLPHPWPADAVIAPGLKLYVDPTDLDGRLVFTERVKSSERPASMPYKVWEYNFARNETRLVCDAPRNGLVDVYKGVYCIWDPVAWNYAAYAGDKMRPAQNLAYVYDAETGEGVDVEFPDAIRTLYVMDGAICALVGDKYRMRLYVYYPATRKMRQVVMVEKEKEIEYNPGKGVAYFSPYRILVCDRSEEPTRLYLYYALWSEQRELLQSGDIPEDDFGWRSFAWRTGESNYIAYRVLEIADCYYENMFGEFVIVPKLPSGEYLQGEYVMLGLGGMQLYASASPRSYEEEARTRRLAWLPSDCHFAGRSPDNAILVFSDKDRVKMNAAKYFAVDAENGGKTLFIRDVGTREYGEIMWWE